MAALGFSTTNAPGFSMGSVGTPRVSLPSSGLMTPESSYHPSSFSGIPVQAYQPSPLKLDTSSPFFSGSPGPTYAGKSVSSVPGTSGLRLDSSTPFLSGTPRPNTTIGGGNPLTAPNIADPTMVSAHIAQVVSASAARIGALQNAQYARAEQVSIGQMDQITAEKLNREDELKIRQEQVDLNEQLKAVVAGTAGPSVAELQYQRTSEEAARQQMGYAAARGTGGNYGLAMREAAQNQGLIQAQQSQGAAELRAQEVATARGQMGQLQEQIRAADIAVATTEANYRQQANMFNAEQVNQAKIRQAELNQAVNELNAQLQTQVSMFNAGQYNTKQIRDAELQTQVSMFNAGQTNATNQFNAGSMNAADQFNSSLSSQVNQTRAQIQATIDAHNQEDARIREISQKQMQQDTLNRATDYNNQLIRDQQLRDFQSQEAEKNRQATAAENEKQRLATITNMAMTNAGVGGSAQSMAESRDPVGTSTLTGMASGAMLGGKVGGPVGAVAGAVIGGGLGALTGKSAEDAQLEAYRQQWAKKHAYLLAAGIDPATLPQDQGGTANLGQTGLSSFADQAGDQMRAEQQARDAEELARRKETNDRLKAGAGK